MEQVMISENEAGQRLDKFLHKYLKEASGSFYYKMLRKKNITLNRMKADGKEKLNTGDTVEFFLSEETLSKFRGDAVSGVSQAEKDYEEAYRRIGSLNVLWENHHVLLVNKPAGILSQKAKPSDVTLNEWLIGYLLHKGEISKEELSTFKPSVCNRLDRNTSGTVICGKTLYGSQRMSALLKDRSLHKYYRLIVEGNMKEAQKAEGYLMKDEASNKVFISSEEIPGSVYIATSYRPLGFRNDMTYVEAELITGKTHQIRAHLASRGYPLTGDPKYGIKKLNEKRKKEFGVTHQLLHAYRLEFPQMEEMLADMSNLTVTAPLPKVFEKLAGCGNRSRNGT